MFEIKNLKKINYWKLVSAILICQLAGIIGSIFTAPSVKTWYTTIIKPSFNPPNYLFGPVWTTLFILMGISLYIIWDNKKKSKFKKKAITIFSIQLFLNLLWSILFFGFKSPLLASIEIVILLIAIAITIYYFYKISKPSAYLLIPYILWVSFAMILNFAIVYLNY
ncbi:MAG: TspO/MBR family protein [Candidatus Woesearchaeota archaeon]